MPQTSTALLASGLAGLSTLLGALPCLFIPRLSRAAGAVLLRLRRRGDARRHLLFADSPEPRNAPGTGTLGPPFASAATGIVLGALLVSAGDRLIPHEHFLKGREGGAEEARAMKRAWLFVAAIAIHNLPEGLAVGAGFGSPDPGAGWSITIGIILQNLPEGLVAAVSLLAVGYTARTSVAVAGLTGLVESLGGLAGVATFTFVQGLVPLVLSLAGGAMLYVVAQEVIPEAYRRGVERPATWGLIGGFLVMLGLDQWLG
ncbi:MAG: ZIP family metal transporter [Planctomycetota bacterium]